MKEILQKYGLYVLVVIIIIASIILSRPRETPIMRDYDEEPKVIDSFIYVDIKGQVLNPGVYKVNSNTRVYQLVEMAGGFTDDVDSLKVNLSKSLRDQQVIYIPSIYDIEIPNIIDNNPDDDLLDINQASLTQLESLPGIGPSTAQKIVDYRESVGYFDSIEDIKNVQGIGDSTFENIKDLITT